jgi:translation initiation factor IF-3
MTNYRRKRRPQPTYVPRTRTNNQIRYPQVKVIDEEEGFLGIMSSEEAYKIAQEKDMDLVEINAKTEPPIVKILDFNKYKYSQAKIGVNKPKVDKDKTIRVSVSIGPHDLKVRAKKCDELLEKDFTVKLQVQMKGREKAHPHVAEEVIYELINMITKPFNYIQEPKLVSDSYFATVKLKKN